MTKGEKKYNALAGPWQAWGRRSRKGEQFPDQTPILLREGIIWGGRLHPREVPLCVLQVHLQ